MTNGGTRPTDWNAKIRLGAFWSFCGLAVLISVAVVYVLAARTVTGLLWPSLCRQEDGHKPPLEAKFHPNMPCAITPVQLEAGQIYRIQVKGADALSWCDLGIPTTPDGFSSWQAPGAGRSAFMALHTPLRRLPQERWFTLMGDVSTEHGTQIFPIGSDATLCNVRQSGPLRLYVNDAYLFGLPLVDRWFFYANNKGAELPVIAGEEAPASAGPHISIGHLTGEPLAAALAQCGSALAGGYDVIRHAKPQPVSHPCPDD